MYNIISIIAWRILRCKDKKKIYKKYLKNKHNEKCFTLYGLPALLNNRFTEMLVIGFWYNMMGP